jgi:hypothetical protein
MCSTKQRNMSSDAMENPKNVSIDSWNKSKRPSIEKEVNAWPRLIELVRLASGVSPPSLPPLVLVASASHSSCSTNATTVF